jgi:protein TonB
MEFITHSVWRSELVGAERSEPTRCALDDEKPLADEDACDMHPATDERPLERRKAARRIPYAFMAAVIIHAIAIGGVLKLSARSSAIVGWHVARGDSVAEGPTSSSDRAQSSQLAPPAIAAPPSASPHTSTIASKIDPALDDASSLPTRPPSLSDAAADAVIGIGAASDEPMLPRFKSKGPQFATAAAKSATPDAGGPTTPPHIAGTRGQRDGFDSRGLPIPDYPAESLRRGEQGVVILDVEVLEDGRVGAVNVADNAGYPRLGHAAAEKVKELASFEPARCDGKPVVGHLQISYRFELQ